MGLKNDELSRLITKEAVSLVNQTPVICNDNLFQKAPDEILVKSVTVLEILTED